MKTSRIFGGASVSLEISSAIPGCPNDPRIAPQIERFLSVMEEAYFLSTEEPFGRFVEAFAAEVSAYLQDRQVGRINPEDPASMTWDEVRELEDTINEMNKKKDRKK